MEIWDLYDENGNKTGETFAREWEKERGLPEGRYHIVCDILLKHDDGSFLLMQRDKNKQPYPGYWEASAGGSALAGETPLEGAKRELFEETGICTDRFELISVVRSDRNPVFFYSYLACTDADKDSVKLQEGETIDYKWVDRAGLFAYIDSDEAIKTHNKRNRRYFEKFLSVDALADRPLGPWFHEVDEEDRISPYPTYEIGKYFDRFHKETFTDADGRSMKYYFFDPREYGYPGDRKYPLLISFHGTGNALVGDTVINYTGAEFYAEDSYQKDLDGAYILIPVANEYVGESGKTEGYWTEDYDETVHALIGDFIQTKTGGVTYKVQFGNSSGARYVLHLMERFPEDMDVAIPIGSTDLPPAEVLRNFDGKGKHLFFALGKRDEFHDYEKEVVPRLPELESMEHCFIFTPEWVRNGDKGIASIFGGIEMGQHCLVNSMHINLMFDDGTPMDERLPKGVTGYLAEIFCGK